MATQRRCHLFSPVRLAKPFDFRDDQVATDDSRLRLPFDLSNLGNEIAKLVAAEFGNFRDAVNIVEQVL